MEWGDFILQKKDDRIDSISVSLSRGMIDWLVHEMVSQKQI